MREYNLMGLVYPPATTQYKAVHHWGWEARFLIHSSTRSYIDRNFSAVTAYMSRPLPSLSTM